MLSVASGAAGEYFLLRGTYGGTDVAGLDVLIMFSNVIFGVLSGRRTDARTERRYARIATAVVWVTAFSLALIGSCTAKRLAGTLATQQYVYLHLPFVALAEMNYYCSRSLD